MMNVGQLITTRPVRSGTGRLLLFVVLVCWPTGTDAQNTPPTTLRIDVVGGTVGADDGETVAWTLDVPRSDAACVDVQLKVVLVSRLEPCFSDPSLCDGAENFQVRDAQGFPTAFGCSDGVDNDGDGVTDHQDPDCVGVTGWRFSVATGDCFNLESVTLEGTVTDLFINPPGRRDFQSLEGSEVVNPGFNDGQAGAVAVSILSATNPVFLEVGEHTILRLNGKISTADLASVGDKTAPCEIRVFANTEDGLVGSAPPVRTTVFVGNATLAPLVSNSTVEARLSSGESAFLRGDTDGDGAVGLVDSVATFGFLFLGGATPPCLDAADADDDGTLQINDGIHVLTFLFLGGAQPVAPGPFFCGVDATPDGLDCALVGTCPSSDSPCSLEPPPDLFCRRSAVLETGRQVVLVDLDQDGNADLVTGNDFGLTSLLSDGNGDFFPPESFDNGSDIGVSDLAVGDVDDDGLADVVVAGASGLTTFFGDAGVLVPTQTLDLGRIESLALGDLDSEAFLDAVIMREDGISVILSGLGDGRFLQTATHTVRLGDGEYSVALGDIEGDGDLDLVVADQEGFLYLSNNQGGGVFSEPAAQPGGARARAPVLGDLNGDGFLEVVVGTFRADDCADLIRVYLGQSDGTFKVGPAYFPNPSSTGSKGRRGGGRSAVLADLDRDGFQDLVVGTAFQGPRKDPGEVAILRGRPDGSFEPADFTDSGIIIESSYGVGDIDGDGDLDLAVSGGSEGVVVFANCTVP